MAAIAERHWWRNGAAGLAIVIGLLILVYSPTLLTRINGSSDDLMADTGEEQIVLNTWGTLHATGYPLFVILGNLGVAALKITGVSPAAAPTLMALFWGLGALGVIYLLILHLTGRVSLAATGTCLFGLTRWVWIHNAIPEVYSFALLLYVLLLLLALWRTEISHRLEWLALIGGIGIAHHRGLVLAIPPVLYAVYPQLKAEVARQPRRVFVLAALGLVGLVPYLYLPLRAHMGAGWVYGEPGTLAGLLDQFTAREVPYIFGLPDSFEMLAGKFGTLSQLLFEELSAPGVLLGLTGLAVAVGTPRTRRTGGACLIAGLTAFLFDVFLFNDLLPPVVLPITLALVLGWIFLADELLARRAAGGVLRAGVMGAIVAAGLVMGASLVTQNFAFIDDLTHDPTGLETIEMARTVPPGSTLMLDWGVRYFAIGFAQDVIGDLKQIHRADHKSDFNAILARGPLVTPDYTFYLHPLRWWQDRLKAPVFLHSAGPHLIQIDTAPERQAPGAVNTSLNCDAAVPVTVTRQAVHISPDQIVLEVNWLACAQPARDLSVYVHLLDPNGAVLAQADESAPVYGLRPLTGWQAGEVIRDTYPLPYLEHAATVQFGLYEKLANGEFKNYITGELPVPKF